MQEPEEQFQDFPDYVLCGMQGLWEARSPAGVVPKLYHPAIIHRDARGIAQGLDGLLAAQMPAMAALPDRRLLGEDVIWCGNDRRGFVGSHRMVVTGRHEVSGPWGAATGRPVRFRVLADRFAKQNRISDEWQVMDTAALLAQTGTEMKTFARNRLENNDSEEPVFCPEVDVPGPYTGRGNDDTWGLAFEQVLTELMSGAWDALGGHYDRACQLAYPGHVTAHGLRAAESFWLGLRAALPDAQFVVHHRIGLEEPLMPPRAALRWSLTGRHSGWGAFDAPTGAWVHVMGISHAEFGPEGLRREWTLYDAVAVWMQILAEVG